MNISNILLVIIFLIGIVYFVLCFVAYPHTIKNDSGTKLLAISPSWAINDKIYDDFGKKICSYGKKLFYFDIAIGIAWFLLH